ncbi:MAG: Flp family type IVb pilin [SAR324 cluster bacterium]|uniref:Flp family type IVb pilin n=1 Tax=SAR324 cluster bacterium TaxID=2024889 RepID=A0A7X9FQX7_9DELT|nr:Flp family type IVb pilin [SAR324 cluster bacterium]
MKKKHNERGASLVEYALLVALIAIVAITSVRAAGTKVSQQFSEVGNAFVACGAGDDPEDCQPNPDPAFGDES